MVGIVEPYKNGFKHQAHIEARKNFNKIGNPFVVGLSAFKVNYAHQYFFRLRFMRKCINEKRINYTSF